VLADRVCAAEQPARQALADNGDLAPARAVAQPLSSCIMLAA